MADADVSPGSTGDKEIITRADAKARGLKRYFTGVPCPHGHVCERFCASFGCVECAEHHRKRYYDADPEKYRLAAKDYAKRNPEKVAARSRAYRQNNLERCKAASRRTAKRHYDNNKEKVLAYVKAWTERNRDAVRKRARDYKRNNPDAGKRWIEKNRDKVRAYKRDYQRTRAAVDPQFKLIKNLRVRLYHALKGTSKSATTLALLGCTIKELRSHIEAQFQAGMTWENWGPANRQWQVDHIKALATFDLSDPDQLAEACHYTNLQPMWGFDNKSKGAR